MEDHMVDQLDTLVHITFFLFEHILKFCIIGMQPEGPRMNNYGGDGARMPYVYNAPYGQSKNKF